MTFEGMSSSEAVAAYDEFLTKGKLDLEKVKALAGENPYLSTIVASLENNIVAVIKPATTIIFIMDQSQVFHVQ